MLQLLVLQFSHVKSRHSTFKYLNYTSVYCWILYRTSLITKYVLALSFIKFNVNDLLGISTYCQIWIVSNYDYLTTPLGVFDKMRQYLEYASVI
jgi:hypothetical protein